MDDRLVNVRAPGRIGRIPTTNRGGAVPDRGVQRVRPRAITVSVIHVGLLPIMRSQAQGPTVGGVITSFSMKLLVYPAIYFVWRGMPTRR